mgnify:FL=1
MNLHFGLCTAVFSAGLLSFFSPCILPLLPLYFGYFSSEGEASRSALAHRVKKTLAFVAGVSMLFFIMGVGAGLAGAVFQSRFFVLFCGAAIVLMGIHQTGLVEIPVLNRTRAFSSPQRNRL